MKVYDRNLVKDALSTLNGLKQLVGLPETAGSTELLNAVERLVSMKDELDDVLYYAEKNPFSAPQCILDLKDALEDL